MYTLCTIRSLKSVLPTDIMICYILVINFYGVCIVMMKSLNEAFLRIYIPVIIRLEIDFVEIADSWIPQTLSQLLLELLADVFSQSWCYHTHPH